MKILYSHRTASKDGQSVHIRELIESFRRLGHEVIVIGPGMAKRASFGGGGTILSSLRKHIPGAFLETLEIGYSVIAFVKLLHRYWLDRPDVIYERYNLFLLAGAWMHRFFGIPYFLEVNAPVFEERAEFGGIQLKRLAAYCQGVAWRNATMALPVSHMLSSYLRKYGVEPQKIRVIPNGINESEYLFAYDKTTCKKRWGLEGKLVIGFTGFLRKWHGIDLVLDWLSKSSDNKEVHLVIAGDGPARGWLEQVVKDLNVGDRVSFLGLIEREKIPELISCFDIALQPGVTEYASPLKLIEYMALGCAIVAPDQDNILELVENEKTALLFDPENSKSFEAQVEKLCSSAELRSQLGGAARQAVIDRQLTWDANAGRLGEMFECAVSRAKGKAS